MKLILYILILVNLASCATNQKSRLAATLTGVAAGAAVGAASAPSDERPELHALYWGGIVGVVTAIAANYYFSDEREVEMAKLENDKLKSQLDFFQNGTATLLKETKGAADKKYFQSGKAKIRLYQIDQWTDEGPNKKYHRDQMIEILPLDNQSR